MRNDGLCLVGAMWLKPELSGGVEPLLDHRMKDNRGGRPGPAERLHSAAYSPSLRFSNDWCDMCKCGHGMDRHFLDYAGHDVCGGVMTSTLFGVKDAWKRMKTRRPKGKR